MSATDPLATVWEALDRCDCNPHGRAWDFRARCPVHDGENAEALHVRVGGDGRALVHCHPHECPIEEIVRSIGLGMADLFPPGHNGARRRRLKEARRSDFAGSAREIANVLLALESVGASWAVDLRTDCAHCGEPGALLQASPRGISFWCRAGEDDGYEVCTSDRFKQALAARVEERGAA